MTLPAEYEVIRELGRGGMGIVHLARDLKLDRQVAIKVLPPHLADQPETRERFLREARTAAQLSHPNIVPVYRADETADAVYFVMAFVDGESLAERVHGRGVLPAADAVAILREVAWALAYAHARGVIHRDVKPENILIERATGRALVTDFGIARDVHASRLTQDGDILGSAHFMSPEQVNGGPLDGRSDLYALGVVGFNALSGKLPFEAPTAAAVLVAHATREPPRLRDVNPEVSAEIAVVIDRCLLKDPALRYATGEEMADALDEAFGKSADRSAAGDAGVMSETQAAAVWRRAAQLQAEALQRLDTKGVANLTAGGAGEASATPTTGYRIRDVEAAAIEAGISRQYVALAMAELPKDLLVGNAPGTSAIGERTLTALLGTAQRTLTVSVTMKATPARALRAVGAVLQQLPFELRLREQVGGHPLDGGVLVFDLPGEVVRIAQVGVQMNQHWLSLRHAIEAEQVRVTLRPAPGGAGTVVTMHCDLRPGMKPNAVASSAIAASFAAMGGLGVTGVLAGITKVGFFAMLGLPGVLFAGAGAGLSIVGYRALYRSTVRKGEREMERALHAVEASLRSEEVFGSFATTPGALPSPPAPRS